MLALCHLALAALLYAAPGFDTVLLQNGGRIVGTVVEESPAGGVTIQIPGGQLRTVPPAEVFRIEYRDGTFGVLGGKSRPAEAAPEAPPAPPPVEAAPPAPATPPAPPAPPAAAPGQATYPAVPVQPSAPPPPPPAPWATRPVSGRPVSPFTFALGLGLAAPGGSVESGVDMRDVFLPQFLFELEGGLRFSPHVVGSLVLDVGVGDSADQMRAACRAAGGSDCTALSARFGLQFRYLFQPYQPVTTWVSLGTAAEVATVSYESSSSAYDLTYSGWEVLRLGAGVDFRTSPTAGWGLFVNAGFGRYSEVEDSTGTYGIDRTAGHAWVQAGARIILFP